MSGGSESARGAGTDTHVGPLERPATSPRTLLSRRATLEGFAEEAAERPGVWLNDLDPLTVVIVRTENSSYRLVVSAGCSVFVQGGHFFPELTEGRLDGSGFGGSLLRVGWIGVGLRMEITSGGRRIITSYVRAIEVPTFRPSSVLH